ncbi:MAG: ClpXP protease specificity-enhancing factor SspB [Pseudomonadota bacterium]
MARRINYGKLMHKAMQGLLAEVLQDVSANGLPGDHHFYITFETAHPGVDIADWLQDRYPEDMTIVIQEWFADLVVMDDRFSITLNFGNSPEPLVVPFASVKTFVDPSVEFGLRFDAHEDTGEDDEPEEMPEAVAEPAAVEESDPAPEGGADVVQLDTFRK